MQLDLDLSEQEGSAVLRVCGDIDVYSAPRLKDQLAALTTEPGCRVVVDLEGVDFLDSTGLGALVGGLERARANGSEMVLAGAPRRVIKLFDITGLTTVFDIHPSVTAAARSVS